MFMQFIQNEEGQDFAEYALILGSIAVVAIAVLWQYRDELRATFEFAIQALRDARGG